MRKYSRRPKQHSVRNLSHDWQKVGIRLRVKPAEGCPAANRQRIAIARAILKNAPIVILDEATAFTDPENEAQLQAAIAELTKDKTLLVIAHRLSTIKDADRIVLLKNGQIEAAGTHEELLYNSELYRGMWKAHIGAKSWAAGKEEMHRV